MHLCLLLSLLTLSTETSSFFTFQFNVLPKKAIFINYLQNIFESVNDLCIGTPSICKKTQFDPSSSISYFKISNQSHPYVFSISSAKVTYHSIFIFPSHKMNLGILFTDNATIGEMVIDDYSLFTPVNLLSFARNTSVLGLQIKRDLTVYYPFINFIYSNDIISHFGYCIEYIDKSKGQVTLGKSNISPPKEEDRVLKTQLYFSNSNLHFVKAEIVTIGDDSILPSVIGEYKIGIDESFSFIQIPFELKKDLLMYYRSLVVKCNEYKYEREQASNDIVNITYYYYLCNRREINSNYIQSLPSLNFHFGSEIITLLPEDLFSNYNDEDMIFNIVLHECSEDNQVKWIIGEPILKHYISEHDYNEFQYQLFINHKIRQRYNQNTSTSIMIYPLIITSIAVLLCGLGMNLFITIIILIKKK